MARSTDAADPDKAAERIDLEKVLDHHHANNSVTSSGLCLGCLADGLHRPAPCETWLLARRAQLAEKQLALLPRRGQSVLRGFVDGANDLGPRPSPQTAPRPPHPADWGVADREPRTGAERYFAEQMQAPDFRSGFEEETKALRSGPAIGSFDDDVVDAEIIED